MSAENTTPEVEINYEQAIKDSVKPSKALSKAIRVFTSKPNKTNEDAVIAAYKEQEAGVRKAIAAFKADFVKQFG